MFYHSSENVHVTIHLLRLSFSSPANSSQRRKSKTVLNYLSLLVEGLLSCGRLAAASWSTSSVRRWMEGDGCDDVLEVSLDDKRACLNRRTPSMIDCRRDLTSVLLSMFSLSVYISISFILYTVSRKNDTALACYNFDEHRTILNEFSAETMLRI